MAPTGSCQARTRTSCLIADVRMPGGIELQALLRTKGYHIPVILVTGCPDVRDRAMRAGAASLLSKPIRCLDRH